MSSNNQYQHSLSTPETTSKAKLIQERLQSFIGTEMFYQLPLFKTRFTDGVKYLSEVADCFWLITDTSVIAKSLINKSEFITIDFKRLSQAEQAESNAEAVILYSDGNDNLLEKHCYFATDFPLDKLRLFFVNDTLMLPSEY